MKTKQIVIGALVGGVSMFLLGWLIYGVLLSSVMEELWTGCNARPMEEMIWWAMIASNLVWGLLLAVVLDWSGSITMGAGAKVGAVLGLLCVLGFDLGMYSMTTMFSGATILVLDVLSNMVMFAVAGLLVAWVMGKMGPKKEEN